MSVPYLLHDILGRDGFKNVLLASLLHFPSKNEFIQNKVGLLEIEYNVQLAHRSKVLIQQLHVTMDDLQCHQLIVAFVHRAAKIQTCIPDHPKNIKQFKQREGMGMIILLFFTSYPTAASGHIPYYMHQSVTNSTYLQKFFWAQNNLPRVSEALVRQTCTR